MVKTDKKDVYIMGQGTYGCVYNPEVSCEDKELENKEYISKLESQLHNK